MNTLGNAVNMQKNRQNEPGFHHPHCPDLHRPKIQKHVTQQNYPEFRMHCKDQDVETHYQVTVSESFPVPFLQLSRSL